MQGFYPKTTRKNTRSQTFDTQWNPIAPLARKSRPLRHRWKNYWGAICAGIWRWNWYLIFWPDLYATGNKTDYSRPQKQKIIGKLQIFGRIRIWINRSKFPTTCKIRPKTDEFFQAIIWIKNNHTQKSTGNLSSWREGVWLVNFVFQGISQKSW